MTLRSPAGAEPRSAPPAAATRPNLRAAVGKSTRFVKNSTAPRAASGKAYGVSGATRSTRAPPRAECA